MAGKVNLRHAGQGSRRQLGGDPVAERHRVEPREFAGWLSAALPDPARVAWEPPDFSPDAADPGTVHLEGLLVSRAWCLDTVAKALPPGHQVAAAARDAAGVHRTRAALIKPDEGFGRSHWMPTFLLYLDEQLRALNRELSASARSIPPY